MAPTSRMSGALQAISIGRSKQSSVTMPSLKSSQNGREKRQGLPLCDSSAAEVPNKYIGLYIPYLCAV